jgi:hypothetical protein
MTIDQPEHAQKDEYTSADHPGKDTLTNQQKITPVRKTVADDTTAHDLELVLEGIFSILKGHYNTKNRPIVMSERNSDTRVFKLKPLSKNGVQAALEKADQYRLLNQPRLAESICLDILEVEPSNQKASVVLLLALSDQFGSSSAKPAKQAQDIAFSLTSEYDKAYYIGIIHERMGTVALNSGRHGSSFDAYEWYVEAMESYEKAHSLRVDGNDDAILRWNTCARIIMQNNLTERQEDEMPGMLE